MATKYPTTLLACPFADRGDRNVPLATAMETETGTASQEKGWGPVNSLPLNEGGIPPKRVDFNGILWLLSQQLFWYQQGGIMKYDATLNYEETNEVFCDGVKYRALKANGPETSVVRPGTDPETWRNVDQNVPAGAIMAFHNVTLGGSDGRRPIFWNAQKADEGWILCDGGTDDMGSNTPNLIDKFIMGGDCTKNGTTGGSNSLDIPVTVSGETGGHALTIAEMPPHNHGGGSGSGTVRTSTSGSHSHTRGSMNITGSIVGENETYSTSGAFSCSGGGYANKSEGNNGNNNILSFNAASSWSGSTSTSGDHSHTVSVNVGISSQGSGQAHTHSINSAFKASAAFDNRPSYYTLAYFVKVPSA